MKELLTIRRLRLGFKTERGFLQLFRGLDFDVYEGEIVGIVGESGSGKSTLAYTIIKLLPPNAEYSGSIIFDGVDLLCLPEKKMRDIRGKKITMVFQDPYTSLNPLFKIKNHLLDVIARNNNIKGPEAIRYAEDLLKLVELPDPKSVMECFPYELSGGMQQRVMIALALSSNPKLIIADEPTTSVDATIQIQILKLLKRLRNEYGFSIILITHSAIAAREICDRIAVIYAGDLVEIGNANKVLGNPKHPYTLGLLESIPVPRKPGEKRKYSKVYPDRCPTLQILQADAGLIKDAPSTWIDVQEKFHQCTVLMKGR